MLFRSNDTATTEIYTLSLHDALPISGKLYEATISYQISNNDGIKGNFENNDSAKVTEVQTCALSLHDASSDLGELEFFAHYITESLEQISSITRPYENDQMLDVMFGEFS